MDNPGFKSLGTAALAAINAATTATVITSASDASGATVAYIDRLEGMLGCTISANFTFGSGGGTLKAIVETTINQGATWIEVWRAAFATASEENVVNMTNVAKTTPYTPVTLSDDTTVDGILGDRFRVRILSAGTAYAGNTSLAVSMIAR